MVELRTRNIFFFHCRYYNIQRNELFDAVTMHKAPSLDLFLFGDSSLSLEVNTYIFEHVHKFIFDTKCFLRVNHPIPVAIPTRI